MHRTGQGLTQHDLASRTGVSRSTIVDLEQGRNTSIGTALKVLAAIGTKLSLPEPAQEPDLYWTADKAAKAIKRELDKGDQDFAIRVLAMSVDFFDDLDNRHRQLFLRQPSSTGRKRWDALLARTFAYRCREHGMKAPAWTQTGRLAHKWYATPRQHPSEAWKQRMERRTPAEQRRKQPILPSSCTAKTRCSLATAMTSFLLLSPLDTLGAKGTDRPGQPSQPTPSPSRSSFWSHPRSPTLVGAAPLAFTSVQFS
ncbi:helix-turn-helix transcriptional regulator [Arthrobacter sp. VKM Ac-2550]|uniref:helix-turn-helix transcriptional regulator n=1 Tax=Crystallibacter permensis TaxID=1938888 RepID=UPI0039B67A41